MTKPLETRKAEALEAEAELRGKYADAKANTMDFMLFWQKHRHTLAEALKPMPTDGEINMAVKVVRNLMRTNHFMDIERLDDDDILALQTLIRRATQPKSCDGLVEKTKKFLDLLIENGFGKTSDTALPAEFDSLYKLVEKLND